MIGKDRERQEKRQREGHRDVGIKTEKEVGL